MGRPTIISDSAILEAAQRLFLVRGARTTTAAVATEVGLSEAAVFKRFGTKADLFTRAMQRGDCPPLPGISERVGRGDVRDQLLFIALEILGFFRRSIPIMMMSWSNEPRGGCRSPKLEVVPPVIDRVSTHLAAEAALGRIQIGEPTVAAHTFVGAIHYYAVSEVLAPGTFTVGARAFLEGLVTLLLRGMAPAAPAAQRKVRKLEAKRAPRSPALGGRS